MAVPGSSGNPKLSALWIVDPTQVVKIVSRALEMSDGNICRTARLLKVSRNTLKKWISRSPDLRNIVISFKESIK